MLTLTESVIIRILGQNTTAEESDFKYIELEELHGLSALQLKEVVDGLRKKKLITGDHRPKSFLALTSAGWELYEKLEKDEVEISGVKPRPKAAPRPTPAPRVSTPRASSGPEIMVTINGKTMPLKNSLSTKEFAGVTEVTVSAELPDEKFYFNNAWFAKKGIKVTVT